MIELDPNPVKRVRKVREADVEAYLVKRVEARGGIAEKFSSPAKRNVPDRLVQWPRYGIVGAHVHFVECKRPGEKPTAAQDRDHKRRREMGFLVVVVDTYEAVDNYLEVYCLETPDRHPDR